MKTVLLLGAGFSRNWGGWLAAEAFEYLMGSAHVTSEIRTLLLQHRRLGGFEGALGVLQQEVFQTRSEDAKRQLKKFHDALGSMFEDMNNGFGELPFEFQQERAMMLQPFLTRFDAIFTLNQDVLMEQRYLNDNIVLLGASLWDGWCIPGTKPWTSSYGWYSGVRVERLVHDPGNYTIPKRSQPYFKLHGSCNWHGEEDERMMIVGANKPAVINQFPLLAWYQDQFRNYLSEPDTRVMVIGYSFGDDHINNTILDAATAGSIKLFIIDPLGVDVLDKNRFAPIYSEHPLLTILGPHLVGASRRSLREIFGNDRVEKAKVDKFFAA